MEPPTQWRWTMPILPSHPSPVSSFFLLLLRRRRQRGYFRRAARAAFLSPKDPQIEHLQIRNGGEGRRRRRGVGWQHPPRSHLSRACVYGKRERERGGWEGSPVFPPQDEEDTITAIRKGRRWEGKTSRTTPPPPPRLFMGGAPQYSLSLSRSTGGSFGIDT